MHQRCTSLKEHSIRRIIGIYSFYMVVYGPHMVPLYGLYGRPLQQWRPSWKMAAEAERQGAHPRFPCKIVHYGPRNLHTKFGTFVKK